MENGEIVLTRQMFCSRCESKNRPYREMKFVVAGTQGFHLKVVERFVEIRDRGFVPHLVSIYRLLDEKTVAFCRVCCVVGCGVVVKDNPEDKNKYLLEYKHVSYEQMPLNDWNSLVQNKDLGYFI